MNRILIIEDDPAIMKGIEIALAEEGYSVSSSADGTAGLELAIESRPDLLILDIMLPGMNGFNICRELRQKKINIPILILSCKKEEIDKVLGFETGADDYLTKPFSIMELKMRIRALLRRSVPAAGENDAYSFGRFRLENKKFDVFLEGKPLGLSVKEFNILKYLVEREGEVVSRDMLLDNIWGYDSYPTSRTVDNYILSIRKKIESDPARPVHLLTVHTLGYKFVR